MPAERGSLRTHVRLRVGSGGWIEHHQAWPGDRGPPRRARHMCQPGWPMSARRPGGPAGSVVAGVVARRAAAVGGPGLVGRAATGGGPPVAVAAAGAPAGVGAGLAAALGNLSQRTRWGAAARRSRARPVTGVAVRVHGRGGCGVGGMCGVGRGGLCCDARGCCRAGARHGRRSGVRGAGDGPRPRGTGAWRCGCRPGRWATGSAPPAIWPPIRGCWIWSRQQRSPGGRHGWWSERSATWSRSRPSAWSTSCAVGSLSDGTRGGGPGPRRVSGARPESHGNGSAGRPTAPPGNGP